MKMIPPFLFGMLLLLAVWHHISFSKRCEFAGVNLISNTAEENKSISDPNPGIESNEPNLDEILALAEAEIEPERKGEALNRALGLLSDADLSDRLNSLLKVNGTSAAEFRKLLVRRWAERDPASAAEWVARLSVDAEFLPLLKQVALAWANKDLASASTWVRALPEGRTRAAVTMEVAYEAARSNPVAALELATALPQSRTRNDLLVHSASQWMVMDSAAATAWVASVPDQNLRDRLTSAIVAAAAAQDAPNSAALALSSITSREEQERATILIVQHWAQEAISEAVASWVEQFQDSSVRNVALQNLLTLWTMRDPKAAEAWLHDLPAGSFRDAAIVANIRARGDLSGMRVSQTPLARIGEQSHISP